MRTRAARSTSKSFTTGGEPSLSPHPPPSLRSAASLTPVVGCGWVRTIGREEAGGVMAASLTEDKQQEAYEITPLEYM